MFFAVVSAITTVLCFFAYDRRVSCFEFLPYVEISGKAILLTCFVIGLWTLLGGILLGNLWMAFSFLFSSFYAFTVAVPVAILCSVVRKRFSRPIDDCFIRCRICEYRLDNLPGPCCPECGTQFREIA